jgi:hypothetical protein
MRWLPNEPVIGLNTGDVPEVIKVTLKCNARKQAMFPKYNATHDVSLGSHWWHASQGTRWE